MNTRKTLLAGAVATAALFATPACRTPTSMRSYGDGLDVSTIAPEHRDEYALFAQRCSKCHALARALDNGHVEDRFWERYVERMRRQPGSGIAPEDVPPILRFLHYYSSELKADAESETTKAKVPQ